MKIFIDEKEKIVEVWQMRHEINQEPPDEAMQYHKQGFRIVVFKSGTGDLAMLTKLLVEANIKEQAKREVDREMRAKKHMALAFAR